MTAGTDTSTLRNFLKTFNPSRRVQPTHHKGKIHTSIFLFLKTPPQAGVYMPNRPNLERIDSN